VQKSATALQLGAVEFLSCDANLCALAGAEGGAVKP